MIIYTVNEKLKELDKTPYWLAKETGISYPTIDSIVKNKSQGISKEVLAKICEVLECDPGDIMKLQK